MDRRTSTAMAPALASAIADAGETITSVSQATGIPVSALVNSPEELTINELGKVGGFLRCEPSRLIGAAA